MHKYDTGNRSQAIHVDRLEVVAYLHGMRLLQVSSALTTTKVPAPPVRLKGCGALVRYVVARPC